MNQEYLLVYLCNKNSGANVFFLISIMMQKHYVFIYTLVWSFICIDVLFTRELTYYTQLNAIPDIFP